MIKYVKVTNPLSGEFVTFMSGRYFNTFYPETTIKDRYTTSVTNNLYLVYRGGYQGFHSLPTNNNVTYSGITQDGSTFVKSRLSDRVLTINFHGFNGEDLLKLNRVLFQRNTMLKMEISTDLNTYYTDVSRTSSYEGGVIEFLSPNPFFYTAEQYEQCESYTHLNTNSNIKLIPTTGFNVNSIYFGRNTNSNAMDFTVETYAKPTITINGTFNGLIITSLPRGVQMELPFNVNSQMIIDNEAKKIIVDGVDVSKQYSGVYFTLYSGLNTLVFDFTTIQVGQVVDVCVKYKIYYGGIV